MFLRNIAQIAVPMMERLALGAAVHAALLGARMAELGQGFVEVIGQERHAKEI